MATLSIRAVVLVLALLALVHCKVSPELQVTLSHGAKLTGNYMTSHRGYGIRAFQGVPYAEPPINELRFLPPVPKSPWTGSIKANNGTRECPQAFGASIIGDEDCLYLNVYAPLYPKSTEPLPVMVFFHGGGFVAGSGSVTLYPPGFLLDHDVILVTGNYRLGILGFLSTESSDLPGNMGLKDQSMLLQWVHDNIGSFGGDHQKVTIFGESAGAASVDFLMMSQQSNKFFQKAILQSGTRFAAWAFDHSKKNAKNAVILGDALSCPLKDLKEGVEPFLKCMRSKSAEEIIKVGSEKFYGMNPPFMPNTETSSEGFIQNYADSSSGLDIQVLIGATSQEGSMYTAFWFGSGDNSSMWELKNEQLDQPILEMLASAGLDDEGKQKALNTVKEYYFKTGGYDKKSFNNVTDFHSDGYFIAPMDDFLVNHYLKKNKSSANTYVYLFSHRGGVTCTDLYPSMGFPEVHLEEDLGVSHVDDLIYLFPMGESSAPHRVPTNLDGFIQSTLTEMWVNFATNGRPTSNTVENVSWKPSTGFPLDYMRIGNHGQPEKSIVGMESGLFEDRVNLWRQLKTRNNDTKL